MKRKKYYKLSKGQIGNIILASRGKSGCAKATKFVKKIDKELHLKKIKK